MLCRALTWQCTWCGLFVQMLPKHAKSLTHAISIGTLPSSWGSPGVSSALSWLELGQNSLSGSLPEAWSSEAAFPKLPFLHIFSCGVSGT